ncbi:MAG: hypothetical protein AB8B92_10855 [Gammaproteobacteria bacterium]
MSFVIRFTTSMFDVPKEDENPINPIYGQSVLSYLRNKVTDQMKMDEPDTEDWGWYSFVEWKGSKYLIGASAELEEAHEGEWCIQVEKQRPLKERLLGIGKMTKDDECLQSILSILKAESQIKDIKLE